MTQNSCRAVETRFVHGLTEGRCRNGRGNLVLSSCEPELQELMRQIDIMISQQRTQWEAEIWTTQVQLKTAQEELSTSRELLQRKELEQQESTKAELISKYEQQLQKVCEELNKLKRSYQKLHRKHMKQDSTGAKDSDHSEVSRLKEKIEEQQRHSADWEQQCVKYQKQLATIETLNKSLTQESQWSLSKEREHKDCCSQLQHLQAQLEKTQDSLHSQALELERLRPLEVWLGQYQREKKVRMNDLERIILILAIQAERLKQLLQAKDQELQRAQQTHSGEVEGMRSEVSKLTSELHQRDRAISSHNGSMCSIREQLREEQQQTEQRTIQLKMTQAQLETLKGENQHLKSLLQRQDSRSPKESLPPSPSGGMVSRFLEEETLRSKELLQILDSHIQNMTDNNTRTVSKYLPSALKWKTAT
uniref:Uncharacterized protein n=1 Tax=Periophthalmus magnuspinnatus TaxID=409849 RepID=A0A3B4B094_9GOBI